MEDRTIQTQRRFLWGQAVVLLILCSPLAGCGVSRFFQGEDSPKGTESQASTRSVVSPTSQENSRFSAKRTEAMGLESLEILLSERHPSLVEIRQKMSELRQEIDPSWLPGARWSDSDADIQSQGDRGDRHLALDWSPGALSREERQERQRSSRLRILSLQLEDTRNRLLLDLRQQWADYWLYQQSGELLSTWLTEMEMVAESRGVLENRGLLGQLEQKVSDWNQRIAESSRLKISAMESINSLSSRPHQAQLVKPTEPGDYRFAGVEDQDRNRRHPLEILAAERSRYSRTEIDYSDPRTWDGLVIGAHARQEHGQPIAGAGQGNKSGDWILTVGVEIPLGIDEVDRFRRDQVETAGSQRLELVRIRKQIQNRIDSTRERIRASQRKMDGYTSGEKAGEIDPLLLNLVLSDSAARFQQHWTVVEAYLQDRLDYQKSVADQASGRFQLVELLATPFNTSAESQSLTGTIR